MLAKLLTPLYEWAYFTLTDGPKPVSRMMFWIDDLLERIDQRIHGLESWDEWEARFIAEFNEEDTDDNNNSTTTS